jgi:hypothetical protein
VQAVHELPVATASILSVMLDMELKTVQNHLTLASKYGQIRKQRSPTGMEHLYRGVDKGITKKPDHMKYMAESWAALKIGESELPDVEIEDALPKEFVCSVGTTIPDLVFWVHKGKQRKFRVWEEQTGSMRGKAEFESKLIRMMAWRQEHCYDTEESGGNIWGIPTLTVFTNAPTEREMQRLRDIGRLVLFNGKPSAMFYFTSRERWKLEKKSTTLLTQPIWLTPVDDTPRSMLG